VILRRVIAVALVAGALATAADKITIQGSTPTARQQTDHYLGSVYIYVGGIFPLGTAPKTFEYLFGFSSFNNATGYITPLLFEAEPIGEYTIYRVRGIGQGFEVALNPEPQTLPFDVLEGTAVTDKRLFTFGFINALVDSSGTPTATSMGAVEFDNPGDGGRGQGGPGTNNDWVASVSQGTVVSLGTTFGISGSGADNTLFQGYRTYSARVGGVVTTK
jgi:hypothetical protein